MKPIPLCPECDPSPAGRSEYTIFTANNQGWQCPVCGYVYAPYYAECTNCNRPEHEKVKTTIGTTGTSDPTPPETK